jgi:hypothetical protein
MSVSFLELLMLYARIFYCLLAITGSGSHAHRAGIGQAGNSIQAEALV